MGKWRQRLLFAALFLAIGGFTMLALRQTLRRTVFITLPPPDSGQTAVEQGFAGEASLSLIEVTPETVQAAVAVMSRPAAYRRTVTLSRYWSGGQGVSTAEVSVSEPWTRVDMASEGGTVRHSITNGETTYIWYNEETACAQIPAGSITADDEQHIPTWEDVLAFAPDQIARAGYELKNGEDCVYVETSENDGYQQRWWISVETGLLTAAERLYSGDVFFRAAAQPPSERAINTDAFTLPDGTVLMLLP